MVRIGWPSWSCSLAFMIALAMPATAAPPRKLSPAVFSKLINASPFTIKPTPPPPAARDTPLERDWMLGSISPYQDGYSVTLINKKDRKDRVRFVPGFTTKDFELLEVKQDASNSSNSRVRVRKGGVTAWLTYDKELIKVRPAAPTKRSSNSARRNVRNVPPVPRAASSTRSNTGRTPRQRSIPKRR